MNTLIILIFTCYNFSRHYFSFHIFTSLKKANCISVHSSSFERERTKKKKENRSRKEGELRQDKSNRRIRGKKDGEAEERREKHRKIEIKRKKGVMGSKTTWLGRHSQTGR